MAKSTAGAAAANYRTTATRSLGLKATSAAELIREVERGLPFRALQHFAGMSGIAADVLTSVIGVPDRALPRRKLARRLDSAESERLVRVAMVHERALRLFDGDSSATVDWLLTPRRALNMSAPLVFCRTELGAREVENLIGRLEHGVFS